MAYSNKLRLQTITDGDKAGLWGDIVNKNIGTLLEEAIAGAATVVVASAAQALTATATDPPTTDEARQAVILLTGTPGAAYAIYVPPQTKLYIIKNSVTTYTATIYCSTVLGNTTAAGTGIAIPSGYTAFVRSDGTNILSAVDYLISPTFVTPALGTPASGVATNLTGTAASLTAGTASAVPVGGITGLGTGVATALAINVGTVGAPVTNGGAGAVFIGDTSNAKNLAGLTINAGGADDEILSLKSSDIAHGMTDLTETDSFGVFVKWHATNGGLTVSGYSEATTGLALSGLHTTDDTTKSTAGVGAVSILGFKKFETTLAALGADANILTVGTLSATRFIFDADGDLWMGGGLTAPGAATLGATTADSFIVSGPNAVTLNSTSLTFANTGALKVKDSGGTARAVATIDGMDLVQLGNSAAWTNTTVLAGGGTLRLYPTHGQAYYVEMTASVPTMAWKPVGSNLSFGTAALATSADTGHIAIPSCAGAPTGAAQGNCPSGMLPMIYDSTNNKLYINTTGTTWKGVTLA